MFLMFLCAFTNTFLGQRRNVQDYFVWHAWGAMAHVIVSLRIARGRGITKCVDSRGAHG